MRNALTSPAPMACLSHSDTYRRIAAPGTLAKQLQQVLNVASREVQSRVEDPPVLNRHHIPHRERGQVDECKPYPGHRI